MNRVDALLTRLDDIGSALAETEGALALLSMGSAGLEVARADAYSDLDFFVIVAPSYKPRFLGNLDWLEQVAPVAYAFQNTGDGHKLLFADGIFCETAVFTRAELSKIPFPEARVVWRAPELPAAIGRPVKPPAPRTQDITWSLGEALTNLYVGLGREARGETLSALRFIQYYAVDRVLELAEALWESRPVDRDPFTPERRVEQRLPELTLWLPRFMPGYGHSRAAAAAILEFLSRHYEVDPAMRAAIEALL